MLARRVTMKSVSLCGTAWLALPVVVLAVYLIAVAGNVPSTASGGQDGGSVTVRVAYGHGWAVPEFKVTSQASALGVGPSAAADELETHAGRDGEVVVPLRGAPPWRIRVSEAVDSAGHALPLREARLELSATPTLPLSVRLAPLPGSVVGRVVNEGGRAVAGVPVRVVVALAPDTHVVTTKEGTFAVDEVNSGTARRKTLVISTAEGYRAVQPILLSARSPILDVVLRPGRSCSGRLEAAKKADLSKLTALATWEMTGVFDPGGVHSRVAPDGTFTLLGMPRDTAVRIGITHASSTSTGLRVAPKHVSPQTRSVKLSLVTGGVIAGAVTGRPRDGRMLCAELNRIGAPYPLSRCDHVVVEEDGDFRFQGVAPGQFLVKIYSVPNGTYGVSDPVTPGHDVQIALNKFRSVGASISYESKEEGSVWVQHPDCGVVSSELAFDGDLSLPLAWPSGRGIIRAQSRDGRRGAIALARSDDELVSVTLRRCASITAEVQGLAYRRAVLIARYHGATIEVKGIDTDGECVLGPLPPAQYDLELWLFRSRFLDPVLADRRGAVSAGSSGVILDGGRADGR